MKPRPAQHRTLALGAMLALACSKPLVGDAGETPPNADVTPGGTASTAIDKRGAGGGSPSRSGNTPCEAAERPQPALTPPTTCDGVGPKACATAPRDRAALCRDSTACVSSTAEGLAGLTIECAPERSPSPGSSAFVSAAPAPPKSGMLSTALVHLRALEGGVVQLGATYLAAELPSGWCLVDEVLSWERDSSYFRAEFQTRWAETESGLELALDARHFTRDSIDAEEAAAGVSELTGDTRLHIDYAVNSGVFERAYHASHHHDLTFAPPSSLGP